MVIWKRDTSDKCSDEDGGNTTVTDGSTSYSIKNLEEGSSYTITVTATNAAGSVVSDPVMGVTEEVGEGQIDMLDMVLLHLTSLFCQFHLPLPVLS